MRVQVGDVVRYIGPGCRKTPDDVGQVESLVKKDHVSDYYKNQQNYTGNIWDVYWFLDDDLMTAGENDLVVLPEDEAALYVLDRLGGGCMC
jgi:hypothetical protein